MLKVYTPILVCKVYFTLPFEALPVGTALPTTWPALPLF